MEEKLRAEIAEYYRKKDQKRKEIGERIHEIYYSHNHPNLLWMVFHPPGSN